MYNKGPSLNPCGTELFTENHLDLLLFKTTLKYRLIKKSSLYLVIYCSPSYVDYTHATFMQCMIFMLYDNIIHE